MSRTTTTLAVTVLAIAGGLVAYDALSAAPRARQPPQGGPQGGPPGGAPPDPVRPPPPPQGFADEPAEGYESRWASQRARAIRRCKQDVSVRTWPQAVTCALNSAFPEAAPWSDPSVGDPWMLAAADLVESDLTAAIEAMFPGTTPTGWQAVLWIRGPREIAACRETLTKPAEITVCAALAIYPTMTWPPPAGSPAWMQEFWLALRKAVTGA